MKQVDEDMLIIKALVGDDFERMNTLIIEMQKSYQDYFRKSQQELVNAMSSMGAVLFFVLCIMKIWNNLRRFRKWKVKLFIKVP